MSDALEIRPHPGPLDASMRPPGSKSITNRALVCAALADGTSTIRGALDSEDSQVMVGALRQLGVDVRWRDNGQTLVVDGCGGRILANECDLFVANSGTTVRFLTAFVALGEGRFRLHGSPRMHARPIEDLLDALRQLGADVRSEQDTGCPPVVVVANGLPGGEARVRGSISSQYLSGLLMAAPYASAPVELVVEGQLVSQPYVRITLEVMSAFGVVVPQTTLQRFRFPIGLRYQASTFEVEPDASAASYFWAAAAICGGRVTVDGLSANSLQGDVAFCECLQRMGCQVDYGDNHVTVVGQSLAGIDVDMGEISDTVQTLAAVALFADGPTTIRGVGHIRHKESDRIGDLARELRRLGAAVAEHSDGMTITPAALQGTAVETYDDHRMAMSLALVGLRIPGVVVKDPACTEKTYPQFFSDLERLRSG